MTRLMTLMTRRAPSAPSTAATWSGRPADMRIVIVGAGAVGLLSAVEWARAGHRVVVLDQAAIPNPRAASFDQHRIVRALHRGDARATHRAAAAHRRWLELQELFDVELYRQVGVLITMTGGDADAAVRLLRGAGIAAEALGERDLARRLPHLVLPPGAAAVLETGTGVVLAARALTAAARWLGGQPLVELRPHHRVTRVNAAAPAVELTDGSTVAGDLVLVATGAWSRDLLAGQLSARIGIHRQTMIYCEPPPALVAAWEAAPAAIGIGVDGRGWLLPPGRGTQLKVSSAAVCRDVAALSDGIAEPAWLESMSGLLGSVLVDGASYRVTAARDCHYGFDLDTGGPVSSRLGPAAFAYPACGGGGFKTAPLAAGQAATELTLGVA
jgi:sarcosine oxidase